MTAPLLHETVSALTEGRLAGRRRVDPAVERPFRATMRNDFLTPGGTPYKWQELDAGFERTVGSGGGTVPTVVPVRYRWQRVSSRTGTPKGAENWREWTFARGQTFGATLLHTDLHGGPPSPADPAAPAAPHLDLSYPQLPKSPAVDLLLMLSWDVVAFEIFCTHLTTTPRLREVGGRAELDGITGSRARFRFSDPDTVASFHHAAPVTAEHLGYGRFAGRPSAVYALTCLDCPLDVRSGPMVQRGRSSYWVRTQVDLETGDLLCTDMTEMIIGTLTGSDGQRVPVQKRRTVRLEVLAQSAPPGSPAPSPAPGAAERTSPETRAELAVAVELAGRVCDYLAWQIASLRTLPEGMAELALMGFRSVVGADPVGVDRQVRPLIAELRAAARGAPGAMAGLRAALPDHRRHLEGLLAFGRLAVDGASRHASLDDAGRDRTRQQLDSVGADLGALLALLARLERAGPQQDRASAPADVPRATDHES